MNKKINLYKHLIFCCLFLLSGQLRAQKTVVDSLTLKVLNISLTKDTSRINKTKWHLNFSININTVSGFKSFTVELIGENNHKLNDLGNYLARKHQAGFYYVENSAKEKKTIYNNEIYFSTLISVNELAKIKAIKIDYQFATGGIRTLLTELPKSD